MTVAGIRGAAFALLIICLSTGLVVGLISLLGLDEGDQEMPELLREIDGEALETEFVDKSSVMEVVSTLADICRAKAYHETVRRKDKASGKSWLRDAQKLENVARKLEN